MNKRLRVWGASATAAMVAVTALVSAPAASAAENTKCAKSTPAQNLAQASAWIKSINKQDWATFDKLTHNDRTIHLTTGAAPAAGNQDDIEAWKHMHRIFSGMTMHVRAFASHDSATAKATRKLPGAGKNVVAFLGDITGTLPDGTKADVPYTAWIFFQCGQIHNEYGILDASPAVLNAMATTK